MSTKRFLKWGEGKPALFVSVAREVAAGADEFHEMGNLVLSGQCFPKLPPSPAAKEMLGMYCDHDRVVGVVGGTFLRLMGVPAVSIGVVREAIEGVREFGRLPETKRREVLEGAVREEGFHGVLHQGIRMFDEFFRAQSSRLVADLTGVDGGLGISVEDLGRPEIQFFIRVWLPCVFAYGEFPAKLLASARRGNYDAIDKLVRVDKSVLSDPRVAEQVHQAHANGRSVVFKRLAAAIKGHGKPVKTRQAKILAASLISLFAKGFKLNVTAPEIQELFDAVAELRAGGETLVDKDLPDDPATFAREVRMTRGKIKVLPQPGK